MKGRAGPVEPATEVKVKPLSKKGVVDGLAPGLRPGSIPEAPIGLNEGIVATVVRVFCLDLGVAARTSANTVEHLGTDDLRHGALPWRLHFVHRLPSWVARVPKTLRLMDLEGINTRVPS